MSTLSKTPDDKMSRYLQRIQKLVGHRAKSPILIKSRNKSPMNVKASRVSLEPRHQPLVKSIISVCTKHYRDNINHFFCNLVLNHQVTKTKRRDSHFSQQSYRKTVTQQNDKALAVRFVVKTVQRNIHDFLSLSFKYIKLQAEQNEPYLGQQITRDIKKSLKHRRTYSEIYAQSLSKYHSKSPATSQRYEYKTPQLVKKNNSFYEKNVKVRLMVTIMQKISQKYKLMAFSSIKSFYCRQLSLDINEAKQYLSQIQLKFISLKQQQQKTVQQLKSANQIIVEQQAGHEIKSSGLQRIKQQSISKNQEDQGTFISEMQRILHQTRAVLRIYQIFNKRILSCFALGLQRISNRQKPLDHLYAKCLEFSNTLKFILNARRKVSFTVLVQHVEEIKFGEKGQKSLLKTWSRQIIPQHALTPTNFSHQAARIQSIQSSKHSRSSQKSSASNFDIIAKKINSAFTFQSILRQIYSYGFQKIDQASFMYMTLSNPINKLIQITSRQSFRKILFYSFFKSQSGQQLPTDFQKSTDSQPLSDSKLMIENKPPTDRKTSIQKDFSQQKKVPKNYQKMSMVLTKVERKIIFMKIQAYSLLKLNNELKKPINIPEDNVISQEELKRQIKDFLFQRNKIHQKTYDTWYKTKQILQEPTHSSSRSSLNSRIKT